MKLFLTNSIFIVSTLFANYAYNIPNSQKIDMHGGNSNNLLTKPLTDFMNADFDLKSNIKEPTLPKIDIPKAPNKVDAHKKKKEEEKTIK